MIIYTIGFSGKSAEEFFGLLKRHGVKTVIDARLNNRSQLAGFTKIKDFPYLLQAIGGIGYAHVQMLAPTKELLDGYKSGKVTWSEYVRIYNGLLETRDVGAHAIEDFEDACILCSEPKADQCHRRLAAEYLQSLFPNSNILIVHL